MPVTVKKQGSKFRVIDAANGKITKTASGSAADGGGHNSEAAAKRQARAINASLSRRGKI